MAAQRFRSTAKLTASGSVPLSHQTARSIGGKMVSDYVFGVRAIGERNCQVSVALGASRLGGVDTTFYVAWWPLERKGTWLVPHAAWHVQKARLPHSLGLLAHTWMGIARAVSGVLAGVRIHSESCAASVVGAGGWDEPLAHPQHSSSRCMVSSGSASSGVSTDAAYCIGTRHGLGAARSVVAVQLGLLFGVLH